MRRRPRSGPPARTLATSATAITALALQQAARGSKDEARVTLGTARRLTSQVSQIAPWFAVVERLVQARVALLLGDGALARALSSEAKDFMSPALAQTLLDDVLADTEAMLRSLQVDGLSAAALTAAELRVLQFLPSRLTFQQIGEHRFLSQTTIKTHAQSIHRKLGASSRDEAVARAQSLGLVESPRGLTPPFRGSSIARGLIARGGGRRLLGRWRLVGVISFSARIDHPLAKGCSKLSDEINELTELACEGSGEPLTRTPVVGTPSRPYAAVLAPGAEEVASDEIRVTILGSGDPFVRPSQASASVLIEVGNAERDLFVVDLGSGAVKNFDGLGLPVTATTKVFLSHLHADHVGDMPTLTYSLAKAGRRDPVEVWGPGGATEDLGTSAYARQLQAAHAWDMKSLDGHPGQSGARAIASEVPFDRTATVYQRNGVTITSFPVIHETFPSPDVYAQKAGVPPAFAEMIVNSVHTSPAMAGKAFGRVGARMSVMWHLAVDHATVGSAYRDMRAAYDGPVTIAQDLTVFNITPEAVVARQAIVDPVKWPVVGPTRVSGPPMNEPPQPPAWWADALLAD